MSGFAKIFQLKTLVSMVISLDKTNHLNHPEVHYHLILDLRV